MCYNFTTKQHMGKSQRIKTTTYKFPVIVEKDEDGFFVADCPDLQGCHTQGKNN